MQFTQAALPVENAETFGKLKAKVAAAFAPSRVEEFLKAVDSSGARIRQFEELLKAGVLGSEANAEYGRLPVSDQAQMREFYLTQLEEVAPELRTKFRQLYRYQ